MPEIKNTAEKETKSESKQTKRRIIENMQIITEATEKILAAVNTMKKKKCLSVAGFSEELRNYQSLTVISMTSGPIFNEIFVYGLGICRQRCYKVGKTRMQGGNMTFPSTASTANCVKSKSQSVHFSSLHTCLAFPLSFLNLSNCIDILEDFNLNFKDKTLTQQLPFGLNL